MLFTNVKSQIKKKKSMHQEKKEYQYIEFGSNGNGLFLSCNLKKFFTLNEGFHKIASIGMSKGGNPKIVYDPSDKDLYLLLYSPAGDVAIEEAHKDKVEVLKSAMYTTDDGTHHVVLVKVLDNSEIKFAIRESLLLRKVIVVKNNFVSSLDNADFDNIVSL